MIDGGSAAATDTERHRNLIFRCRCEAAYTRAGHGDDREDPVVHLQEAEIGRELAEPHAG